ncbi:MAG: hypothetical protein JO047_07425 [Alphaproteobacteria bacterium]|nr:hypothetical protein [Alphaproteobacteria bacterium]
MSQQAENPLLRSAELHHQKIKGQGKGSAADALAAGQSLLEAKAATPGKRWLQVLKQTTSMNPRTVQRYMLLARAQEAGILGEDVHQMSFSEAYRLAVRQALRIARNAGGTASSAKPGAAGAEEQNNALKGFRQALRAAIAAGVPYRRLERELQQRISSQVLSAGAAAEAGEKAAGG